MVSCSGSSTLAIMSVRVHVRHHVGDVDAVLFYPFLCGAAWRGGGGCVPVEPLLRDVGQVVLEGRPVLGGALAGFVVGVVAQRGA